jgi:hypothetical protein
MRIKFEVKIAVVFFLLLVAGASAFAQNIKTATIVWNATSVIDLSAGDFREENQKLTSFGSTSIEWESPSGKQTFQVSEILGQWNTISSAGEIVYEVKSQEKRGTITFIKNENGISIRILLVDNSDTPPANVELKISNTQVQ